MNVPSIIITLLFVIGMCFCEQKPDAVSWNGQNMVPDERGYYPIRERSVVDELCTVGDEALTIILCYICYQLEVDSYIETVFLKSFCSLLGTDPVEAAGMVASAPQRLFEGLLGKNGFGRRRYHSLRYCPLLPDY